MPITISTFDLANAAVHEYAALNRFLNIMSAEKTPDDPPALLDALIAGCQNIPDFASVTAWTAWDTNRAEVVACAFAEFLKTEENTHMASLSLDVHPDYRRRGLGREMLRHAIEVPRREGRRMIMATTDGHIPAGEAFMLRLGAERGMSAQIYQLRLEDIHPTQIAQWLSHAQRSDEDYTLGFWDGAYPEDQLESIVHLHAVMNTEPRGSLEIEDSHVTGEQLRQMETAHAASGLVRWTLFARETATGGVAGMTELTWHPSNPQVVNQRMTGVLPELRGQGLGKRLKAAAIVRILQERPEVKFVRTGNADSNAAIRSINEALGFKPYVSTCYWQADTDQVLAYLAETVSAIQAMCYYVL